MTGDGMTPDMRKVLAALRGKRFPLEDEKQTQAAIGAALGEAFPEMYEREVKLTGGIIDFAVIGSTFTGIEVKIKGQPAAIVRQIKGYAGDARFGGFILATSKPVAVPGMIGGKPVAVLDLARAWL